jgi:murein DD-endopeptidase MepM/ murein hydrolase activator NlpD
MRRAFAVAAMLVTSGCATSHASDPRDDFVTAAPTRIDVPASAPQGSLVRGTVPPGTRLVFEDHAVRVGDDGRFVIGLARERTKPAVLDATLPDHSHRTVEIAVTHRDFPLERINGVPEDTVNPPPAIAERIADEQAQVARARTRDDDRNDFESRFQWPVKGRISGVFGSQRIYNGTPKSPHSGLDIAAPKGTPVHAPAAGIVIFADPDLYLTGGTVLIDHGHGVSSSFLHLSRIDVKVGDRVEQGQVFGLVGATGRATGPHMHWGLNWFETRVDPQLLVDPADNPQPTGAATHP